MTYVGFSKRLSAETSLIAIGVAFGLMAPGTAVAQSEPSSATAVNQGAAAEEGSIVVTGSRVMSAFNAPTPVNTVSAERLEKTGIANIGDALNQLPSFRQVTSPATNLYRQTTNTAARTMDLRGLGDSRTLVLVDGRRFVPSSELGTVDLNAIPSSLVARADVVTGGASAAYGANAVAGVVNLILDTSLTGIKGEASYGISRQNDAENYTLSLAAGGDFAGDRGHFVLGGEYVKEKPAGDCFTRDWCSPSIQLFQNPGFNTDPAKSNGLPATLLYEKVWTILNPGGVIASGPLRGTTFDPKGNPIGFQFGDLISGTSMVGGDPSVGRSLLTENVPLKTANKHISTLGHLNYAITDTINAVAELSYAEVTGGPTQGSHGFDLSSADTQFVNDPLLATGGSGTRVKIGNPYLPTATRNAMIAAGVATIPINKYYVELAPNYGLSVSKTFRSMVGFNGDVGGTWKWDAYYQYGQTRSRLDIYGLRNVAKFAQSVDAVFAPDGKIVCRSSLTNPSNGCVPFNVFGERAGSAASIASFTGNAFASRKIGQHAAALNFRGDAFSTWAGPIATAIGVEYRRDSARGEADATSKAAGWNSNSAFPLLPVHATTTEGYVEASIPLLKDAPFGKSLVVDGAARYTHTSNTGNAVTWKAGLVYEPSDDFLFRVTRSHDIRAPSFLELSPIQNTLNLPVNDPNPATIGTYYVSLTSGGNPSLKPERANTLTIGGVFKPSFIPNFHLSVDYYKIDVGRAIAILTGQQTVNVCAAGNTSVCPFIVRGAGGVITQVFSTYQNLGKLHSEGIEFVADYSIGLDGLGLPGRLSAMVNATRTIELTTTDATGFVTHYEGWTGNPGTVQSVFGVPKWRADGLLTYSTDRFSLSTHGRYVGPGVYDPTKIGPEQDGYSPLLKNSINYNRVESRLYWDLSVTFDVLKDDQKKVQVFGAVYNLFDKDPPFLRLYGNPVLFDAVGRAYRVGVRTSF